EFVALLPMTNCEGATRVATMLLETIRSLRIPHAGSSKGILTISIGVACWQAGSTADAERLLEKADSALYRAKESGRDTYRLIQCGPEAAA
ncbi:MAG TPA: GGDEF domain-containing protein, partial [Bryobacteraceae bacterium]|nr:GGDEF domain-containing protein [Bryobacteraceae bacterium]